MVKEYDQQLKNEQEKEELKEKELKEEELEEEELKEEESVKVVHEHVECDGCGVYPIEGIRYKCSVMPNFDFCASCEE